MRLVLSAMILLFAFTAHGQGVYKWTDAQGVVQYGDRPPAQAQAQQVEVAPASAHSDTAVASRSMNRPASAVVSALAATPLALDIVMYSRADCGFCTKARHYLASRGIGFVEKDIQRDAAAYAEWRRFGGTVVPLFLINGDVSNGFSESSMAKRLARYTGK